MAKKRKKRPLIYRLKRKADQALSRYTQTKSKYLYNDKCPLCQQRPIKVCFHFITRKRLILRWDEQNVVGACKTCNFTEQFYPDPSRAWFIQQFSVELYLKLVATSKDSFIPTTEYLEKVILEYEGKLKVMEDLIERSKEESK